ncbi:MAG TPA: efflux transporter outer membrane subunit, partial [Burkholderiales bacterium]|nr:efflux transporter outer membrane subunit [Burkholderiales bacterium]
GRAAAQAAQRRRARRAGFMRRIAFLPLLAALAACTVGPDYRRPEMPLPAGYGENAQAGAVALALDWWKLYRDPALDELVAAARKSNADVRLAAARVQEAEGALREARAAIFPDVTGSYGYSRQRVSTVASPPVPAGLPIVRPNHTLAASTSFEVDFWGRFGRASEAARANLLGTQLARDVVDLTLAGAVAQAYFALRSLDSQIVVLDNTIRGRRDSLEITRARAQAGLAADLDVYQAQAALADALAQKRDAERNRALVAHQLAQLAGRLDLKLAAGDVFALPLAPLPPPGLPSALLDRRPDIRQAEEALVAANAQIGIARAALFPTLSLTGQAGVQSADLNNLLTSGAGIWTVGFGLALPLFDAGRRQARVDQAQARREQAVANYQRAVETGFREVADALVNVQQTGEGEAELLERLQAARNALELSTLRYQAGYSFYLEVLDAQRTANDAELAFVRNRQARLAFSVDLMKALGGGWKAD